METIKSMTMNVSDIERHLSGKFSSAIKYRCKNIYVFAHDWETDYFVQRRNGYCIEIEIKVTRSDFFADFKKKDKHEVLKTGQLKGKVRKYRPNKFYYAVPEGLIKKSEVPEYAGLLYIGVRGVVVEKPAPFIHKEVLELESKLCMKFYARLQAEYSSNYYLKLEIEDLKKKIKKLNENQNNT